MQFSMPNYTWRPSNCKKTIEYKLENQTAGAASLSNYPSFFKFDLVSKKVTMSGNTQSFGESDKEFTFRFFTIYKMFPFILLFIFGRAYYCSFTIKDTKLLVKAFGNYETKKQALFVCTNDFVQ